MVYVFFTCFTLFGLFESDDRRVASPHPPTGSDEPLLTSGATRSQSPQADSSVSYSTRGIVWEEPSKIISLFRIESKRGFWTPCFQANGAAITWESRQVRLQAKAEGDYMWFTERGWDDWGPTNREMPRRQAETIVSGANKDLQGTTRAYEAVDAQIDSMSKSPVAEIELTRQKFQTKRRERGRKKGGPNIKSRGPGAEQPKTCYTCNRLGHFVREREEAILLVSSFLCLDIVTSLHFSLIYTGYQRTSELSLRSLIVGL